MLASVPLNLTASSFAQDLDEITLPSEQPPLSFCDIGGTLAPGGASERKFSPLSGDSASSQSPLSDIQRRSSTSVRPSTPRQPMSYNSPDDANSCPDTVAHGKDLSNMLDHDARFNTFFRQPELDAVSGPFNLPEIQNSSQDSDFRIPNFITTSEWKHAVQSRNFLDILEPTLLQVAGGTSALHIGSAASSINHRPTPSHCASIPTTLADHPVPSSTREIITPTASLPCATAVALGPSIPTAVEEIALPSEKLVFLSYNYGATLTLGNALKKDFSLISGDSTQRAFPSRDFAVKLAIWLEFGLGNEFRPRRKQVTVVTTKKSVIEQPSKSRLAHLAAREMERYVKECELRQKPFPYSLDDIVLRRIDLTSKGTIRPRLYIHPRRRSHPIPSISMATN